LVLSDYFVMPFDYILGNVRQNTHVFLHDFEIARSFVYLLVFYHLLFLFLFDYLADDLLVHILYLWLKEELRLFLLAYIPLVHVRFCLGLGLDLSLLFFICLVWLNWLVKVQFSCTRFRAFMRQFFLHFFKFNFLIVNIITVVRGIFFRLGKTCSLLF
jgi:hypothetical protein